MTWRALALFSCLIASLLVQQNPNQLSRLAQQEFSDIPILPVTSPFRAFLDSHRTCMET
jgi:hypothetical protein